LFFGGGGGGNLVERVERVTWREREREGKKIERKKKRKIERKKEKEKIEREKKRPDHKLYQAYHPAHIHKRGKGGVGRKGETEKV